MAKCEEIISFLDHAQIAYDKQALKQDFVNSDVNGDGKLSLEEFIEVYKRGSIADRRVRVAPAGRRVRAKRPPPM
jgi:Ca2+-binding EF-hand superfamily protein